MTANLRYLNASFFSFCFHAAIFLYLYGTFNSNSSQNLLISKPLQVELKFESEIKSAKQETVNPKSLDSRQMQKQVTQAAALESSELRLAIEESMLYSNLSDLLEQEESISLSQEQEQIFFYSQKIINTIENAWMKPRNIPEGLVANLRLHILSTGRISKVYLIKSSGNIRFDNSALQAVRRVETLNFFNEIPSSLYKKEFKKIAVSFKPS
ncbi:TonB C-terminal domain-containing protein [bacterium]|jgi:colicin import membrane protein|nr:TonB C-terminal domain-containing protein [bacterium]MDA9248924.1 TonB C-terminal domain-containing protein [Gammaproteobacteria bacterium]MDA9978668.1 TonB C-terminal domain-containing protein [Gammaproteobacteria bacterium]MDB0070195.1 TonB C-terminal domain-containing protein [Gammaproteobacteria bacterium]MDB3856669.1 TonB C-terminal domain-containing protein [Gammaproteobacteria bacterium]|tara:strand:- start:1236 stop:1868 length:633 start_codon:yes stop_codon:yes gene_type:complete